MVRQFLWLIFLALTVSMVHADDYSGQFVSDDGTGGVLELKSREGGRYVGTLSSDGFDVAVIGRVVNGALEGMINDDGETVTYRAELTGTALTMTLMYPGESGEPMGTLRFVRKGATAQSAAIPQQEESRQKPGVQAERKHDGDVVINSQALSAEQRTQLEETYGIRPLPGEYWYDARSGLYGVVGYQAYGFMYPGHDFGPLRRDISAGNTGVFVNGRELPAQEWLIWSYMLGYPIQMGAYWLDAQGNAGYEGNPVPTVNLFVAAQQNAYRGQGGSGDNFWSSRFGAGNSNAANTQGYVSVPGHGPVGYGF